MKIRALIVDDEQLARQRVRLLLGEEPDVDVIGESEDGFQAVEQIQATKPDLVFLDEELRVVKTCGVAQELLHNVAGVVDVHPPRRTRRLR